MCWGCLTVLVNGKIQIKAIMKYHFTITTMAKIKGLTIPSAKVKVELLKPINSAAGSVNLYIYFGEQFGFI